MSRFGSHTHRAASVARHMLAFARRGAALGVLLFAPLAAHALPVPSNSCEIVPTSDISFQASYNQVIPITFRIQPTVDNVGVSCDGTSGVVNNEAQGTYSVTSSLAGTVSSDPYNWQGQENETITILYDTGTTASGGGGPLYVFCESANCSTSANNRIEISITVVDRQLQPLGETTITSDPNQSVFIPVRATNDGVPASEPVQINWSVSGPATLQSPTSSSDFYGDAVNNVFIGDSTPGNNVVTVVASRADNPSASITYTINVNTYELAISTPPPGTVVMAGDDVTLTVEYRVNGTPAGGVFVDWAFDENPNGSALQQFSTGVDGAGIASNLLTVGAPNPGLPAPPIKVRATVSGGGGARAAAKGLFPPLAETVFTLQPMDVIVVSASSGDDQSADVGDPLAPMVVNVTRNGSPDAIGTVTWTVDPAGAAQLSSGQSNTDGQGNATVTVTRVDAAGPFTVTASHNDDPSRTAVFNAAGIAPTLALGSASGDDQTGLVNEPMAQPLRVQATANGSPQPGVTINWTVSPAGFATVTPSSLATGADGFAEVIVTNGPDGGNYTVTATRADDPTASYVFTLTAQERALAKPSDSGNAQFGATGSTLADPLVVVATLNGAAQSGVGITWSVVSGAATLANAVSPTDAAGRSSVEVTLGDTPGTIVVRATRDDDTSIFEDFTVQAFSKMLVKPGTGSGDGQSGGVGSTLPQPLVAIATLNGTAQPGVDVSWAVQSGSATLSNITSPTDNAGRSTATVTLGSTGGTVVVRATRTDEPTQFQDYTLTTLDVRTLDKPHINSGDNQSGRVSTELPQPLVVFANNNGSPAAGVTVNWTASNGATVTPSSVVTDANGRAEVSVRLGPNPGTVTVTATRADASTANASFVLTATAAPVAVLSIEKPPGSGDGTALAPGESVRLTARTLSNAVPDANVPVFWEIVSGSARVGAEQSFSDSQGLVATLVTAGMTPGPVIVRATHGDGGGSVTYALSVTGTGTDVALSIVSGDDQTAAPGTRGSDLVVRLTQDGVPIPNAVVSWQVLQGAATLDSPSSSTDAAGESSNGIEFGSATGDVLVQASANGATATFHLRVAQQGAVVLRLVSGNHQTGPVGTRADEPIVVEVFDTSTGEPVANRTVNWEVQSGSATLDAPSTLTDASGRSLVGFTFGPSAGSIRIRADIGLVATQVLLIDATAFQPTLSIVSGDNQSAPAGTPLPQDLVVQIAAPGNAKTLAGVTVQWDVIEGGGTLAAASTLTDANGLARNQYTLGPANGTQRIEASIAGGAAVTFTANATSAVGALVLESGNNQVLPTRAPSAPLVVTLANAAGTPIEGAVLTWSATNAELASVRTTTDAQGRASNVAEVLLPGTASVTVLVEGVTNSSSVTFTLTGGVANTSQLGQPEETVANAIDALCPALVALSNPTPEQADLRARCLELVENAGDNPEDVGNALDELRQDVALAQANAAFVTARAQFDNVKTRIAALRSGASGADFSGLALMNSSGVMPLSFLPSAVVQDGDEGEGGGSAEGQDLGSDFSKWGFFASGIIGRGSYDGSSVTPEYDYDTNGLTAGVDYRVNDQWIVGASVGWNQQDTELSHDAGAVDTNGWSISGYTTWYHQNQWYFDGVLTFGSNDYELSRAIRYSLPGSGGTTTVDQVARADTGGDQLSLAFSFGRDFQRGNLSFGPYLRGMYTRVDFDSYEEVLGSGPGSGLGLAVEERELTSMTAVVGGKMTWAISREWGILMPHAQLEWEHEFEDDPQQLATRFLHDPTGTTVRAEGDAIDTDFFNIGFGLSALFANGRSAFLYYEHLAGSEGLSQDNLSLGVRIEF